MDENGGQIFRSTITKESFELELFFKISCSKGSVIVKVFVRNVQLAHYCSAWCFIMQHELFHLMGTHISQKDPRELEWTAIQFLEMV